MQHALRPTQLPPQHADTGQALAEVIDLPRRLIARPFKDRVPANWEASQRIPSGDGPDWIGLSSGIWMRVTRSGIEYTDGERLIYHP